MGQKMCLPVLVYIIKVVTVNIYIEIDEIEVPSNF